MSDDANPTPTPAASAPGPVPATDPAAMALIAAALPLSLAPASAAALTPGLAPAPDPAATASAAALTPGRAPGPVGPVVPTPGPSLFAPEVPALIPAIAARPENVGAADLSSDDVEALFAAAQKPVAAVSPGSAALMGEADMQRLLRSLNEDEGYGPPALGPTALPAWAADPKPRPYTEYTEYTERDVYSDHDDRGDDDGERARTESDQILRDLEVTVATIDDRTVAIRDSVTSVYRDLGGLQEQMDIALGDSDTVKAQNVALVEEVRDLRASVETIRAHLATLIQLVAGAQKVATAAATPPAPAQPSASTVWPVVSAQKAAAAQDQPPGAPGA